MSARAQLILKQLGISPWVERASATDIIANQMLWRDQSDDQVVENRKLSFTDQTIRIDVEKKNSEKSLEQKQEANHNQITAQVIVEDSKHKHAFVKEEVIDTENDQNQILDEIMPIDAEAVQATIHFDYQVLIHESFLIFAHAENSAQHRLLQNIQKACLIRQSALHLSWPLNIASWQLGDAHLQDYLRGFLQSYAVPNILILGEIDFEFPQFNQQSIKLEQHATLAEMLENGDAKRKLWRSIQSLMSVD
ncbi:hypothetical protein [Acinetobacter sp.]|uniref:hypothetical protein n=1 Tax=Acinetobacter sp. TaxID=472 RepID=UPI0035B035F8